MRHASKVLAITVLLLSLPLAYLGGYFWLPYTCEFHDVNPTETNGILHLYTYRWQQVIFYPAAEVESWLRGRDVRAGFIPGEPR
jgi:hypothetical protein